MVKEVIAEISASSLQEWHAICINTHEPPLFGSLITVQQPDADYFGIVHQIATGPTDSLHTPFPLRRNQQEIERDYPHMPQFLQTTISCLAIGYIKGQRVTMQWPSQPPFLHAPVTQAPHDVYARVIADHQYLSMVFHHTTIMPYLDELLLAVLARIDDRQLLTPHLLEQFIEQFSLLSGNDYRRLKLFLQRAGNLFSHIAR